MDSSSGPQKESKIKNEARGKRPFKIWDSWRNVRKGVVVGTFEELLVRGKDKLGVPASEPVRLVLESDGTHIEDGEYFRTLANNTILLLLRQRERWYPTGADVIKAEQFIIHQTPERIITDFKVYEIFESRQVMGTIEMRDFGAGTSSVATL